MQIDHFYRQAMQGVARYTAAELHINPNQDYRIVRASNEPRLLTVQMAINPRHLRKLSSIVPELSMAAGLGEDEQLRISRGRGPVINLEFPKPKNLWFNISPASLPHRRGLRASIGLDTSRAPAAINFADPLTPHSLVAGATGAGKTKTQQLLAWSLAQQNNPQDVEIIIIDVEKRGLTWQQFNQLPHLAHPVITAEDEARRVFGWAMAELDQRQQQQRTTPRTFIFVDELRALIDAGGFEQPIARLTTISREYGIHFIGATQHPTIEVLGNAQIKRNITARLVGRVDDANAAYIATGQKNTNAEMLTSAGDFLLVQPGSTRRLTVALLTQADFARLPIASEPRFLDLSQYEDVDHVLNQTTPRADPLEPSHLARALAENCGITKLCNLLKIGPAKAKRVNSFADELRKELHGLGYQLCPIQEA